MHLCNKLQYGLFNLSLAHYFFSFRADPSNDHDPAVINGSEALDLNGGRKVKIQKI